MFREIKRSEKITDKDERIKTYGKNEGFRKIKPQSEITEEEAKNFINSLFAL